MAWDDYTAVYKKFDDTKRAVSALIDNCWHRKWTGVGWRQGSSFGMQGANAGCQRCVTCCVLCASLHAGVCPDGEAAHQSQA